MCLNTHSGDRIAQAGGGQKLEMYSIIKVQCGVSIEGGIAVS